MPVLQRPYGFARDAADSIAGLPALFLSGCATTCPANPPLQLAVPGAGYEYRNVRKESGKGDTLQRGQAG